MYFHSFHGIFSLLQNYYSVVIIVSVWSNGTDTWTTNSHKGEFYEIENLESEGAKLNLNIEKIAFKYVQMKSLHITNQSNVLNIFTEHDLNILMIFGLKEKSIILTHDVLLAIASSIPVLLKTGVVVQGHILLD